MGKGFRGERATGKKGRWIGTAMQRETGHLKKKYTKLQPKGRTNSISVKISRDGREGGE